MTAKIKGSKKTQARNRLIKQLDDLARERCFERDQHSCVRCGNYKVQWAHVISRRHLCVRWELDNNLSLCGGCHEFWWHSYPSLSGPWFIRNWPERHENITSLYNAGGKVDLRAILEDFKSGEMR